MVDRSVKVYLKGDISDFNRKMLEAAAGAKAFTNELDTSTDRVANLTQSVLALGPALVPIAAAGVPAVAGLANQLGIGAAAAGVAVLAFHGLGKALDAVNNYSIDPTAANLEKMHQVLGTLGPAGQDFVLFLQRARPEIANLQELARAGLFPGVEKGLRSLSGLLPDVQHIITTISGTLGDLASEAGANLDSPKWHEFIAFLDSEARPTLLAMGRTAGNFAEGLANLWMAFAPLENNFSRGFLGLARDFATWTDGLNQTQGFQNFIAYINSVGPEAWSTLGSLANALLQIVEAAAPVGQATLPVIKAIADAIGSLADSQLGPVVIGIVALTSAYSRLIALGRTANTGTLGSLFGKSTFGGAASAAKDLPAASRAYLDYGAALGKAGANTAGFATSSARLGASLKGTAKLAGGAAGLAFVMSGYADKVHLANTATLALAGSMFGPEGAAIGGTIGLIKDLRSQHDGLSTSIEQVSRATAAGSLGIEQQGEAVGKFRDALTTINAATKGTSFAGAVSKDNAAFKALNDQYQANVRAAQDAQFAENGLAGQMVNASQKTRDQTSAVLALRDAHNKLANELLASKNAELAYEQALDDAAAGASKNHKGLDENTAAGRANLTLLYQLAGAWNALTPAQQNAKGAADRARSAFVKDAEQMGATKAQANRLANAILGIPSKKAMQIILKGQKEAAAAINAVKKLLAQLSDKTVHLTTIYRTVGSKTGTSVATGGYIRGPGTSTSDSIPAWLSDGEYVVNAAATKKHFDLLHRINSHSYASGGYVERPQKMQKFASGGLATGYPGLQPLSVSMVGMRVSLDKDGFGTFVDGRIDIGLANAADFAGTVGRM